MSSEPCEHPMMCPDCGPRIHKLMAEVERLVASAARARETEGDLRVEVERLRGQAACQHGDFRIVDLNRVRRLECRDCEWMAPEDALHSSEPTGGGGES